MKFDLTTGDDVYYDIKLLTLYIYIYNVDVLENVELFMRDLGEI